MSFDYSNINLIPKMCIVNSRSECDTSTKFGSQTFRLPVVPANMECVMNEDLAKKLAKHNYFYSMHRFNVDVVKFCKEMILYDYYTSISLGVNVDSYTDIDRLVYNKIQPDYITIDIAHGHSTKMKQIITYIKESLPKSFIIAGNVSTPEGVRDLESWGAHAIKVGIGPGSACTTYNATGFGSRGIQASIIQTCAKAATTAKIVADGGVSLPGDIAKSLVLGASMVMIGGMFSGLNDSPGNTVQGNDGQLYKEFWGSASAHQSNKKNRIEGTKKLIVMKQHSILQEMTYIEECLQSAVSYGGGNNLDCFHSVEYIIKNV
uniref:GMP reductase n=1 Tax=viral metagenome TaxID=1070528 RepID=A0A6C0D6F4_9ZZZZ